MRSAKYISLSSASPFGRLFGVITHAASFFCTPLLERAWGPSMYDIRIIFPISDTPVLVLDSWFRIRATSFAIHAFGPTQSLLRNAYVIHGCCHIAH